MPDEPKLDEKLEPKEEREIPKGDEDQPISAGVHEDALKNLYKKARKNREELISRESEEHVDAARLQAMMDEAAGGGEGAAEELGTKSVRDMTEEERQELREKLDRRKAAQEERAEEQEDDAAASAEEREEEAAGGDDSAATIHEREDLPRRKDLDYEVKDGKVEAKVHGRTYLVPEADVIAAGGLEAYQRQRAAQINFHRAARFADELRDEAKELDQARAAAASHPPKPGDASGADLNLDDLQKEIAEKVLEGDSDAVKEALEGVLRASQTRGTEDQGGKSPAREYAHERVLATAEEVRRSQLADAQLMLTKHYGDIMEDPDLKKIAQSRYHELAVDPENLGRLPVEMAREAAEFVKGLTRGRTDTKEPNEAERERKLRVERKRRLQQPSDARGKSEEPPEPKPPSARDHIRRLQRASGNRPS